MDKREGYRYFMMREYMKSSCGSISIERERERER